MTRATMDLTPFNKISRHYPPEDGRHHLARLLDAALAPLIDLAAEDLTVTLTLIPGNANNAETPTAILSGSGDVTIWQVNGDSDEATVNEVWLTSDMVAKLRALTEPL